MTSIQRFWSDEQGQDWTLGVACVALVFALLLIAAHGGIGGVWSATNSQLLAATTAAG